MCLQVVALTEESVSFEVHPSIMADKANGLPFTLFIAAALQPFETKSVN